MSTGNFCQMPLTRLAIISRQNSWHIFKVSIILLDFGRFVKCFFFCAARRVFQCMVVIYFIDDMPQLKEQTGQRLSMKTLTRDQYERVLVANIQ